jgi:hypothetical protein
MLRTLSVRDLPNLCGKILLLLPYHVLVGATILLAPTYLDQVAFPQSASYGTQYLPSPPTRPEPGIYRFAHWAMVAETHLMAFGVLLLGFCYLDSRLGLVLSLICGVQAYFSWIDFLGWDKEGYEGFLGSQALGEDDRASIWIAAGGLLEREDAGLRRDQAGRLFLIFHSQKGEGEGEGEGNSAGAHEGEMEIDEWSQLVREE